MSTIIFPIKFESVLGDYDIIPPTEPQIVEIETIYPELTRKERGWKVT